MSSLKKSLFWSLLEQGGSKAVSLVVQIVLARILAPEAFGIVAILLVVINLADSIAQSGMGVALIQKKDVSDTSFSTAFWLSLVLSAVLFCGIWIGAPVIADFYQMGDMVLYVRGLGIIVVLNSANSIQRSYLQRNMRFDQLFKSNFAAVVLSGVLGIAVAILGFGIWALIAQLILQSALSVVFVAFMVPWRPSLSFSKQEAVALFDYGWKICVTGVLNVLYIGVTELVIGKVCSASQLGLYSQGRKYPQVAIGVITNAISNVLFPALSQVKDDKPRLVGAVKNVLYAGNYVIFPVSLFFVAAAEPIVLILLTEKWIAAVPIFQLMFLGNALLMFQLVNLRAYMALGDSALYMRINIIKVVFGGGILCLVAIVSADIYATALAACLVSILGTLFIDMPFASNRIGYGAIRQLKDQLPVFVLAAVAFAVAFGISLLNLPSIILLIIQTVVFFGLFLLLSKALGLKGLVMIVDSIKRKRS